MDVVFNSISGMQSKANVGKLIQLAGQADLICYSAQLKCAGLADVEFMGGDDGSAGLLDGMTGEDEATTDESERVAMTMAPIGICTSHGNTAVKLDKNFSYAIFVSYSEVYNEKVRACSLDIRLR